MKHVIRILIIMVLTVSIAFSATFPKGIIAMKDGRELRVKKVSIQDNFVYYRLKNDQHSALLEDVEYVKVRGKITNIVSGITGGASALLFSAILIKGEIDPPIGYTETGRNIIALLGVGTTTATYLGGRFVGGILDPWRRVYTSPAPAANPAD